MVLGNLDTTILSRRLSDRLVGRAIFYYDVLESTMEEAGVLAGLGEPEGTVIVADEQTAGRGRFGRVWVSLRGQDILLSVILRPDLGSLPYVNMAATLAVSHTITELTGFEAFVKWPNDVKIRHRKISGILVDSVIERGQIIYAVVGIGINVNSGPLQLSSINSDSTSLYYEVGRVFDRTDVLATLLERFDDFYGQVKNGDSLIDQWSDRLETIGNKVRVKWSDRQIEGEAFGVDAYGNLLISNQDGSIVTVVAGDVTLQSQLD